MSDFLNFSVEQQTGVYHDVGKVSTEMVKKANENMSEQSYITLVQLAQSFFLRGI